MEKKEAGGQEVKGKNPGKKRSGCSLKEKGGCHKRTVETIKEKNPHAGKGGRAPSWRGRCSSEKKRDAPEYSKVHHAARTGKERAPLAKQSLRRKKGRCLPICKKRKLIGGNRIF